MKSGLHCLEIIHASKNVDLFVFLKLRCLDAVEIKSGSDFYETKN